MNYLSERVLVLNKNFYPLCVISVEEAIKVVYSERAVIMDENYNSHTLLSWEKQPIQQNKQIRTINRNFPIPEVIRLISFEKTIEFALHPLRENIFQRDDYICQYCREKINKNKISVDHVIPKSRKKEFNMTEQQINGWNNMVACCRICNGFKNDRTPEEANMELIKLPSKPKYKILGLVNGKLKPSWKLYLKE